MSSLTSITMPSIGKVYADQNTPLIRDCWYVAGLAAEIGRDILCRRLLGTEVALYRKLDGTPVALRNRCPHRSFPLAKGKLDGDTLICGYHGMKFDPDGRCVDMPAMPIVPTNASVRSFPLTERGPLVWIWMGNPDCADEELVPDTSWLSDPNWTTVQGGFYMKSDYVAMHENLLDQTHFPFLHAGNVGTPAYARSKLDVRQEGNAVIINRFLPNSPPPGIYGIPMGLTDKLVDRYSDSRFISPAGHIAFARIVNCNPAPGARDDFRVNISHLYTPETNNSIHYWWFSSRNFKQDDAEITRFFQEANSAAYVEDVDALEWISQIVQSDNEPQFDLNFAPDKPGLMMRRTLQYLADLESGFNT